MIRNRFDGFATDNQLFGSKERSVGLDKQRDWTVDGFTSTAVGSGLSDGLLSGGTSAPGVMGEELTPQVSLAFGRIFDSKFAGMSVTGWETAALAPQWIDVSGSVAEGFLRVSTTPVSVAPTSGVAEGHEPGSGKRSLILTETVNLGDGAGFASLAERIGGDIAWLTDKIRSLQLTQSEGKTVLASSFGLGTEFSGDQAWMVGATDVDYHGSSCPHCRGISSSSNPSAAFDINGRNMLGNGGGGGGGGTNNFRPRVTLTPQTVESGRSILVSTFFEYFDLENDPMAALRIIDRNADSESGFIWYRGQRIAANQWLEVPADQVGNLRFFGGVVPLSDNIGMLVSDGVNWSPTEFDFIHTVRPNLFPPTAQGFEGEVLAFESVKIRDFIRATDPEDNLQTVRFIDRQNNPNSGFFSISGQAQQQGRWFEVNVDEIDNINYHGGRNGQAEFVAFQVWDGRFWSNIANFRMSTIPNVSRPIVVAPEVEVKAGQVIQVANWITFTDADGNTPKRYRFYDTGNRPVGGFFTLNGQEQVANSWFEVQASELTDLRYHASNVADFEKFRVMAFDGRYWSDIATGSVTVKVRPTTDLPDMIVLEQLEQVFLRDVFNVDGNGLSVKNVQIYVPRAGVAGPHVRLGSASLAEGRYHEMTWQDFQNLQYIGGAGGDSTGRYFHEMLVRFDNGVAWSDWERVDTVTEVIGTQAIETGTSWSAFAGQPVEVTYSFPLTVPFYYADDADERNEDVRALNGIQQQRVRDALEMVSSFANITFREVADSVGGMMRFMFTGMDDGILGWAYFPSAQRPTQTVQGDVWFSTSALAMSDFDYGTEGWLTVIHEIGHAIGLGHPFTTPGESGPQLPSATNNHLHTVMSYTRVGDLPYVVNQTASSGEPYGVDTMMLYDVMEIQRLYGATAEQNHDDTVYRWANQPFRETLRDTGGFDTIDASNFGTDQYIDLRPGRMSNIGQNSHSVLIMHDTRIENAIGGRGSDEIVGNELNNVLTGNFGSDTLEGRGGTDLLLGGVGNDTYIWRMGDGFDVIDEQKGTGRDEIHVYGNHSTQNAAFGTIDDLEEDFTFRRIGRDLRIDFNIDRGEAMGGFTIRDQAWGGSRVETLRIFGNSGQQLGVAISLDAIFAQATDVAQRYRLTDIDTPLGFIAVPV